MINFFFFLKKKFKISPYDLSNLKLASCDIYQNELKHSRDMPTPYSQIMSTNLTNSISLTMT